MTFCIDGGQAKVSSNGVYVGRVFARVETRDGAVETSYNSFTMLQQLMVAR